MLDVNVGEPVFVKLLAAILRCAGKRKGDAILGQPTDLVVGFSSDRPAVDVGRLGPPSLRFLVVEDPYGHVCLTVA